MLGDAAKSSGTNGSRYVNVLNPVTLWTFVDKLYLKSSTPLTLIGVPVVSVWSAAVVTVIIDVGVNAPGMKMSKKNRKKLNNFISEVDGFKSVELISKTKAEFTMSDGSKKTIEF